MFRANTVFVIGAGASAEFGLPVGSKLLTQIAKSVNITYEIGRQKTGDYMVAEALRRSIPPQNDNEEYNRHLHSAWQLVRSSNQGLSIDNVIDALEDQRASLVGKIGIVANILQAEEKSPMSKWADWQYTDADVGKYSQTWIAQLVKLLTENVKRSGIANIFDNVTIINFNYDRTIEQYLPFAIAQYFGSSLDEVRSAMSKLKMFRPYGKAGNLPWENQGDFVNFGDCSAVNLTAASRKILTFTQQIEDNELVQGIRDAIQVSDRIIFLGFGFHRQNLSILSANAQSHVQVLGTSFGLSQSDSKVVCSEIERALGLDEIQTFAGHNFVTLHPLTCNEFMSEVWRTLTSDPGEDPTMHMPDMDQLGYPVPEIPSFRGLNLGS